MNHMENATWGHNLKFKKLGNICGRSRHDLTKPFAIDERTALSTALLFMVLVIGQWNIRFIGKPRGIYRAQTRQTQLNMGVLKQPTQIHGRWSNSRLPTFLNFLN